VDCHDKSDLNTNTFTDPPFLMIGVAERRLGTEKEALRHWHQSNSCHARTGTIAISKRFLFFRPLLLSRGATIRFSSISRQFSWFSVRLVALFVVFFQEFHGINENFADRRELLYMGIVFAPPLAHWSVFWLSSQPYYGTGHILMVIRCRGKR
jgi:hypothetical protein